MDNLCERCGKLIIFDWILDPDGYWHRKCYPKNRKGLIDPEKRGPQGP